MKNQNKILLALSPIMLAFTNISYAADCDSPCLIEGSTPEIRLLDSTAGADEWEIEVNGNANSQFVIGLNGGSSEPFRIEDGASSSTLHITDGGKVGINTATTQEELTINSTRPGIRLNDTTSGAFDFNLVADGSQFALEDAAGNNIITVEGNTTSTPLYLDSDGDVGIQVSNPIADLQVGGSGDILLENGTNDWALHTLSSGLFFRQGNNTVSGTASFGIETGAPNASIRIKPDGDVGMGTFAPDSALHIRKSGAAVHIEDTNVTAGNRQLLEMENNGGIGMRFNNTAAASTWDFNNTNSGNFTASKTGTGGFEFEVQGNGRFKVRSFGTLTMDMRADGNLHIPTGDVIVGGSTLNVPDYVFEHDYELMPLDELKGFVAKNKHLPNVPSEAEIKKSKQLSMAKFQMAHLEKIEELTLYTLQQHDQIKALTEKNELVQKQLDEQAVALKAENGDLKERLASLEKLVTNLAMGAGNLGKGDKVALK